VLRRALIGLLIALLTAGPAAAGTIVVKLTFASGKLSIASPRTALTPSHPARVSVALADARSNAAGWTLRASRQVTVRSIRAHCAANSTCTLPKATRAPKGAVVLAAAKGTGMGIVELDVTLEPSAPAGITFAVS